MFAVPMLTTDELPAARGAFVAWYKAQDLEDALVGLAQYAQEQGAHAVVGVKITPVYHPKGYLVYGTCLMP